MSTTTSSIDGEAVLEKGMADESRSIMEAIEAASLHSDDRDEESGTHGPTDLEKAPTQTSTRTGHEAMKRIATAQDWDGPDDPGNPLNWPLWWRRYNIIAIAFLGFNVSAATSLISPAVGDIEESFHVSHVAALLPITTTVIGLAVGPMIAAPLSENFGRTIIYKITPPIYLLFLLGAGFTDSFAGLLICRLLAGVAGAPVLAVGSGSIADLFPQHERAQMTSLFIMAPFLGPALGPVIGGFASQYKGWRWTIWCMEFMGLAAWLLCLPLAETFKKVILQRRARKLGIPGPPASPVHGWGYARLIVTMTVARPLRMLFREPIVLLLSIYTSFVFGVLYAFFAAFPYVFGLEYGFNTWQSGLAFLGIGAGVVLGVVNSILCDRFIYQKLYRKAVANGQTSLTPEHRLYAAMMGAVGLPIGLFWFAWTARSNIHWISPILAGVPFAFANISLFIASIIYMVDIYGPLGGASSSAANGFMRYFIGAFFPLFTVQMYKALGIGWATSLLGFVSIVLLPIPFAFFRYGPQIRARSKLAFHPAA